jgi:ubiquinone/menaquinone biosynthesis C-methylase UbiE
MADEKFHGDRLDADTRNEFFNSGEEHIRSVLELVRRYVDPAFTPTEALDFGCGVGRLLIPLSRICNRVVGVDVSDAMLLEAQRNCDRHSIGNVELAKSDDQLSQVTGTFDLIHSVIVFQHIPPIRGIQIFRSLLARLANGGVGVLHFTYERRASYRRRIAYWIRNRVPIANGFVNLARGRSWSYPFMQMNNYRMNQILAILQDAGCEDVTIRFTDHGGHLGAILVFRKGVP